MQPKLRDGNKRIPEPYPLGQFSKECIYGIAKQIVYIYAIGKADISGEEWGNIFAKGICGDHLSSPLGLADVVKDGFAWSTKSVKCKDPLERKIVRVISGRNSPTYSYDITNPHEDIQDTGDRILQIWNSRIDIAMANHDGLRIAILVRNINLMQFTLFEIRAEKYNPESYKWKKNLKGNFEGYEIATNKHKFTWQPHGSQFTIKYSVPDSAVKFSIKRPSVFDFEETIKKIGFDQSWVSIR